MKRNKAIAVFLLGTFSQIISACLLFFLLNHFSVQSNLLSILGIFLGGISSALWGIIVANHYFHIHFKKIVNDFFNIHTSYKHYLLSFFLIVLDFSFLMFGGKMIEFSWYLPSNLLSLAVQKRLDGDMSFNQFYKKSCHIFTQQS